MIKKLYILKAFLLSNCLLAGNLDEIIHSDANDDEIKEKCLKYIQDKKKELDYNIVDMQSAVYRVIYPGDKRDEFVEFIQQVYIKKHYLLDKKADIISKIGKYSLLFYKNTKKFIRSYKSNTSACTPSYCLKNIARYLALHSNYHSLQYLLDEALSTIGVHKLKDKVNKRIDFYNKIKDIISEEEDNLTSIRFAYKKGLHGKGLTITTIEEEVDENNASITSLDDDYDYSINNIKPRLRYNHKKTHGDMVHQRISYHVSSDLKCGISKDTEIINCRWRNFADFIKLIKIYNRNKDDDFKINIKKMIFCSSSTFGFSLDEVDFTKLDSKSIYTKYKQYQNRLADMDESDQDFKMVQKMILDDYTNEHTIRLLKSLLCETDSLFVLAAGNESLECEAIGHGVAAQNKPLADEKVRDHSILVGNFNVLKSKLDKGSNVAGDFSDIFVIAPGAANIIFLGERSFPSINLYGGTSNAAPFVASMIAMLQEAFPEASNQDIRQAIFDGADNQFKGYDVSIHGYGIVNFKNSWDILSEHIYFNAETDHEDVEDPMDIDTDTDYEYYSSSDEA